MIKAIVYRSAKRKFDCKRQDNGTIVTACALGNLLKNQESIVVGDIVIIEESKQGYNIVGVEKRKNEVYRLIVRENKKKITAANCDLLAIVTSASKPEYKRGIIDRFLIRAHQWNIRPIVIFNKMDQYNKSSFDIVFERDRLKELEVECFEVSAKLKSYKAIYLDLGIEELLERLKNITVLFLGQSGVGKSKIISLLSGGKIDLKTKEIGKAGKGTHSTTWSEIIDFDDFRMIDSPGIRSFSLDDFDPKDLMPHFPDLADISVQCKFNNCSHEENELGCAFREQFDPNLYQTKLLISRLESYIKIYQEASKRPLWQKIPQKK